MDNIDNSVYSDILLDSKAIAKSLEPRCISVIELASRHKYIVWSSVLWIKTLSIASSIAAIENSIEP